MHDRVSSRKIVNSSTLAKQNAISLDDGSLA
jgi:hypothetical protein